MESQIKLENLYKYRFPFEFLHEWEDVNIIGEDEIIEQSHEIKNLEGEFSVQFFIDRTLPFIKYLQSELHTKKKNFYKYLHSKLATKKNKFYKTSSYSIDIKDCEWWDPINLIVFYYKKKKFKINENYPNSSLLKGCFKIYLRVFHFYKLKKIIKKSETLKKCPAIAYKLEQCVICLDNKPNILYKPCLHYCVCSQCVDKGNFENCPYCREKIEKTILIGSCE